MVREDEFSVAPPERQQPPRRWIPSALMAAVLIIVAATSVLVFRPSDEAEAVVFAYNFEEGEKRSYELSIDMKMVPREGTTGAEPFNGTVRASLSYEVVEKKKDGSTVLDMKVDNVLVEPNPSNQLTPSTSMRMTIARDGRVLDVEGGGGVFGAAGADPGAFLFPQGTGGGGTDNASSQFFFPQYPADAVAPGDTWTETHSVPLPFGGDEIKVTANGRHDGFEDSRYGRAARMHSNVSLPMDYDFTMAELFDLAKKFSGGQELSPPPPGTESGRFVIDGSMVMDADTLVLPDGSDIVRMDGTMKMSMSMGIEDVPQAQLAGVPGQFAFDATMKLSMIRVDEIG